MSVTQLWITIAIAVLGTMFTRFISFMVFPTSRKAPKYIVYLGTILPSAVMAMLVVYTYKDMVISILSPTTFPTILATVFIIMIHLWRRNLLLSIFSGTILYMILIQSL